MHVSIVIVGYRNAGDIAQCLRAIETSDHTDFDVVIVENGGRQAYDTLVAAVPGRLVGGQSVMAVLAEGNLGYAGGVNKGIALSPAADCWWVLNPDTEPSPSALSLCLARLARGDCNAVGCAVVLPGDVIQSYGGRWRAWLARAESIGHGTALSAQADPAAIERQQSYLNGACMLVDRVFMQTVGPMREDYFLYCEEVEWFLRARARGVVLGFADGATVLHAGGTTTGSYDEIRSRPRMPIYLNERNKILLVRDCTPSNLPVAAVSALIIAVLRYARRGAWRQLAYAVSGILAGLANQRGAAGMAG